MSEGKVRRVRESKYVRETFPTSERTVKIARVLMSMRTAYARL